MRLAHPAGDQLRVLSAEVDDENRVSHRAGISGPCRCPGPFAATSLRSATPVPP
jgi:hypothetical protein